MAAILDTAHFEFIREVGNGLVLTEILPSDKTELVKYLNDREIYENTTNIPYPYTAENADQFINKVFESFRPGGHPEALVIRDKKDLKLMGIVGFHGVIAGHSHKAEIGYWLAKPFWSQGLMTEVVRFACQYAFEELGVVRIFAKVHDRNPGSKKVLEKSGFKFEGLLRKDSLKDGELLDVALFALLKDVLPLSTQA